MEIPTLITHRLTLRPFVADDATALYRAMGDREVMQYFPGAEPPPPERMEKVIAGQLAHWQEHRLGWWAVVPHEQEELIGWCGLQYLPETDETEVGYLLGRTFWGQGLATEAARVSVRYGFENLELKDMVAIVHPENKASQRVIEKLGMTFAQQTVYFGMDCYRYTLDLAAFQRAVVGWDEFDIKQGG